jgi:hypothetical protein
MQQSLAFQFCTKIIQFKDGSLKPVFLLIQKKSQMLLLESTALSKNFF